jgi:hypothetical protein
MKNLFYLIITLFIISSINTSCKKKGGGDCWTPDTIYIKVGESELKKIPYTGLDTLKFKNEATGIVYTFIGQGVDTSLTYYQRWFPDMCPEEFQKCQSKLFKYVSLTFPNPILLRANHSSGNQGVAYLSIRFNGVDYSKSIGSVGFGGYIDTINGQVYHNINNLKEADNNWTNHIKYDTKEGILKVIYENKIYSKQK